MTGHRIRLTATFVVATALLVAACGDDSDGAAAVATTRATTTLATSTASGGDAGDGATETTDAPDDGNTDGGGAETQQGSGDLSLVPEGETDLLGNQAGQGFVEIGGTRYDFVLNAACQKLFGAVQADGGAADGSDVSVSSVIPPEDWETDTEMGWDPPYVEIDIGDDSWRAEAGSEHFVGGENVVLGPEQSAVTSFTNDGARVAGEAVFYSAYNFEEVETATGAFEFYCP